MWYQGAQGPRAAVYQGLLKHAVSNVILARKQAKKTPRVEWMLICEVGTYKPDKLPDSELPLQLWITLDHMYFFFSFSLFTQAGNAIAVKTLNLIKLFSASICGKGEREISSESAMKSGVRS